MSSTCAQPRYASLAADTDKFDADDAAWTLHGFRFPAASGEASRGGGRQVLSISISGLHGKKLLLASGARLRSRICNRPARYSATCNNCLNYSLMHRSRAFEPCAIIELRSRLRGRRVCSRPAQTGGPALGALSDFLKSALSYMTCSKQSHVLLGSQSMSPPST